MTKPFDPTKPVETRDGRPARIICTDRKDIHPLVAIVTLHSGYEKLISCKADGCFMFPSESDFDLVNTKIKKKGWINIYKSCITGWTAQTSHAYPTKEKADSASLGSDRIACIEIEWEED